VSISILAISRGIMFPSTVADTTPISSPYSTTNSDSPRCTSPSFSERNSVSVCTAGVLSDSWVIFGYRIFEKLLVPPPAPRLYPHFAAPRTSGACRIRLIISLRSAGCPDSCHQAEFFMQTHFFRAAAELTKPCYGRCEMSFIWNLWKN
jgi:hypothetical protein